MVNLLAVRHAESVWNLDGRWQGQANPPDALVVSHAGVIYTLERYFDCVFKRIDNLGGRRISVQPGEVRLQERIALTGDGACLRPTAPMERR